MTGVGRSVVTLLNSERWQDFTVQYSTYRSWCNFCPNFKFFFIVVWISAWFKFLSSFFEISAKYRTVSVAMGCLFPFWSVERHRHVQHLVSYVLHCITLYYLVLYVSCSLHPVSIIHAKRILFSQDESMHLCSTQNVTHKKNL